MTPASEPQSVPAFRVDIYLLVLAESPEKAAEWAKEWMRGLYDDDAVIEGGMEVREKPEVFFDAF